MPSKIIVDTDPGVDDAQAIAYAVAHPDIDLLGLTTVFGNADITTTTRNALTVLELLGVSDVPIARGAGDPLAQDRFAAPDFVHGQDALGNLHLPLPKAEPHSLAAAEFIVEQANRFPQQLCLVAIGPLTNLAVALELDKNLPDKIKQVVIMGGTVLEPGNVTPLAEANFIQDPHAADRVLAQAWPCTIVGLDVTHRTLLFESDLAAIRQNTSAVGDFLWRSSRFYFDYYRGGLGLAQHQEARAPMHDTSALVYLTSPEVFQCQSGGARVICEGPALGQLALDRKGSDYVLNHWQNRPMINVAMQVEAAQVRTHFVDTLCRHF